MMDMIAIPTLDAAVLLVEDNPADALLTPLLLGDAPGAAIRVTVVDRLEVAIGRLRETPFDAVLLDLDLPDSRGLDTLRRLRLEVPEVPVVVMSGLSGEGIASDAVRFGAQDYLVKGTFTGSLLRHAIRHAIERQRTYAELRALSCMDELTGLHNRRGFELVAVQDILIAPRRRRDLLVAKIEVHGLRAVNSSYGYAAGDDLIRSAAQVVRRSFRCTDVIARDEGDAFLVLIRDAVSGSERIIQARLEQHVEGENNAERLPYDVALSVGFARGGAYGETTLDELMLRTEEALAAATALRHEIERAVA